MLQDINLEVFIAQPLWLFEWEKTLSEWKSAFTICA